MPLRFTVLEATKGQFRTVLPSTRRPEQLLHQGHEAVNVGITRVFFFFYIGSFVTYTFLFLVHLSLK
jgi:hypothetical protein